MLSLWQNIQRKWFGTDYVYFRSDKESNVSIIEVAVSEKFVFSKHFLYTKIGRPADGSAGDTVIVEPITFTWDKTYRVHSDASTQDIQNWLRTEDISICRRESSGYGNTYMYEFYTEEDATLFNMKWT